MRSYVIHMSASTARAANVARLLEVLPEAEMIEAVNGRDPAQVADIAVVEGLHRPRYPFALRPGEVGCLGSHRRCWQRLLDSRAPFALIAEDDLLVDPPMLERALDLVASHADPGMYVRLPVKAREVPAEVVAEDGEMRLILPKVIGLQTVAQVVGRDAAARLLEVTARIDRPVDTLLQMHWITGQPVHSLLPNGNREAASGGSTVQGGGREGKLRREFARALYRARVALRPQHPPRPQ